jgi:hypothetical protein
LEQEISGVNFATRKGQIELIIERWCAWRRS